MNNGVGNHQKTILITGVSGFIGSRLATYLNNKYDVYGLSRSQNNQDGVEILKGDFGDADEIADVLGQINPDVVIHCAGVTPHNAKNDNYTDINVEKSSVLLNEVKKRNIKFINLSSISVYGVPTNHDGIVREDDTCTPLSPYAQSKYDFEQVLEKSDVRYTNIRIANIPGRDGFINAVLRNGGVTLFGDEPYIRDYIHLDDLCDLVDKAVIYSGESVTINAGSGAGLSFPDIVDEIERQTEQGINRVHHDAKSGDVIRILCDIATAKDKLGWTPQYTNVKDIVEYALLHKQL